MVKYLVCIAYVRSPHNEEWSFDLADALPIPGISAGNSSWRLRVEGLRQVGRSVRLQPLAEGSI